MRSVSLKTAARNRRYARDRRGFLEAHPLCQIGWDVRCTGHATEVHHQAGRLPSVFFDQSLWRAACHHCHHQATVLPAEAIRRGVSVSRFNPYGDAA